MRPNIFRQHARGTLGTFGGVFTPSVLTILGIILFRRLGYVVGSAGLERALLILGLSHAISILTAISLSAIATNFKVRGGGDYYLISRTLGVEFGGAIGIVLFLAQSVSVAFYCMGFAEALSSLYPAGDLALPRAIAGLAVALLFVFAWLGADWATRLQYVIMAVLAAALVSFFYGGLGLWDEALLAKNWPSPAPKADFWILFAIFFPAVTGFTQGVSMSGDLKDPGKSLPLGTFLAVGVSLLVYLGAALVFAAALPGGDLIGDYEAMKRVARIDWLVDAGVIAATLSSAMASFLGAPRILQSIARDRIFPVLRPFAQGAGPSGNPRRAVVLSAAIALVTVGLGNLNVIAPVVSMFFLISYGLLNYATFFEARAASPSFRPRFRFFDARLSLLGAGGCLAAMLAIDLASSAVALALLFAVYQYLKRTAGPARWADSRYSYHFQSVRESLHAMGNGPEHPRDWRPCILVFCEERERLERLLRFATWIEGGSGLTTAVRIVEGEGERALQLRDKGEQELHEQIAGQGLKIFSRVLVAPDFRAGVQSLLQSFGIGRIRANTVLLGKLDHPPWVQDEQGRVRFGRELQEAIRLGCNAIVLDFKEKEWAAIEEREPQERRIDVWWWGDKTSQLMLLLAYLVTRNEEWEGSRIRVLAPSSKEASQKALEGLKKMLEEVRIDAEPRVVPEVDLDAVVEHSRDASLVFFPLRFREVYLMGPSGEYADLLLGRLPLLVLTLAAGDIDLVAGPEEGKLAEKAAALDAAKEADEKAAEAEREAEKAAELVEKRRRELKAMKASDLGAGEMREAEAALREAEGLAKQAAEKASAARAQAQEAAQEAEALGVEPAKEEKGPPEDDDIPSANPPAPGIKK